MTMTFVVMGLGTVFNALVNRRDPASGLTPPIGKALAIGLVPVAMLFLATQLPTLQSGLLTVPLTPHQWLTCAGLAALLPIAVELGKVIRRRRQRKPTTLSPEYAVAPARAWTAPQA
jgi:Ca2+-transporting ATPase